MDSHLEIPPDRQPRHVAIIMDGNGRWARQRHLPRIEGHRRGAESVRRILKAVQETSVSHISLYAFSVENWQRPRDEVDGLMNLLVRSIRSELKTIVRSRIRLRVIGRTEDLPAKARQSVEDALEQTAHFTEKTLTLALNYGSRTEIVDAVNAYISARERGYAPESLTSWEDFVPYLYTADLPDPDLVIRTSGEFRVSNFLLLQSAYAEFIFTPVLWPDFSPDHLFDAIREFASRERRFGKTSAQIGYHLTGTPASENPADPAGWITPGAAHPVI